MTIVYLRDTLPFATVAAAARFIPIPFMDDVVKSAAVRGALARLLAVRSDPMPTSHLKPLYESGSIFGALLRLPLKVLLYPIRKVVKILSAARGVPRDFLEVFLLIRSVSTALDDKVFAVEGKKARRKRAKIVRKAFDEAFDGADLSLLSAALGEVLSRSKTLTNEATKVAKDLLKTKDDAEIAAVPTKGEEELEAAVESTLESSEIAEELRVFDERFTKELAEAMRR